ncbi:MAG: aminotransferase class I/II-fold pyridoxal phosphate-dependent enzyme, partial [Enterobacteriaceae bacterium]
YEAEDFVTSEGGFDGLITSMDALLLPSPVVCVAIPAPPLLLDILERRHAKVIPVACDDHGPVPESLAEALQHNPTAFFYQPNVHLFTGVSVTRHRLQALAGVLQSVNTLIIEHDITGELFLDTQLSMGTLLPERTIFARTYTKIYSPDLRLAVLSGSRENIQKIYATRGFGIGWSSRFLQGALACLLQDDSTRQSVSQARSIYNQRRQTLVDALSQRGVTVERHNGFCVTVAVPSEEYAVALLAEQGIAVSPGKRYGLKDNKSIVIATSRLPSEQADRVAYAVAKACCVPEVL